MDAVIERIRAFHHNESGATTTEYLLVLVLISLFAAAAVAAVGENLQSLYTEVHEEMSSGEIRGGMSADND